MVTCRVPEPSGPCLALSQKDLVNPAYPPIHQDHCPFPYSQHLLSLSQGCSVGFLLYSFNNHHSSLKYISHLYFGPSTSSLCSFSFHLVLNCFSLSQLVCKVVTHCSENSIKQTLMYAKCQEGLILKSPLNISIKLPVGGNSICCHDINILKHISHLVKTLAKDNAWPFA